MHTCIQELLYLNFVHSTKRQTLEWPSRYHRFKWASGEGRTAGLSVAQPACRAPWLSLCDRMWTSAIECPLVRRALDLLVWQRIGDESLLWGRHSVGGVTGGLTGSECDSFAARGVTASAGGWLELLSLLFLLRRVASRPVARSSTRPLDMYAFMVIAKLSWLLHRLISMQVVRIHAGRSSYWYFVWHLTANTADYNCWKQDSSARTCIQRLKVRSLAGCIRSRLQKSR